MSKRAVDQAVVIRALARWALIVAIYAITHGNIVATALAIAASVPTWRIREVTVRDPQIPHDTVFIEVNSKVNV